MLNSSPFLLPVPSGLTVYRISSTQDVVKFCCTSYPIKKRELLFQPGLQEIKRPLVELWSLYCEYSYIRNLSFQNSSHSTSFIKKKSLKFLSELKNPGQHFTSGEPPCHTADFAASICSQSAEKCRDFRGLVLMKVTMLIITFKSLCSSAQICFDASASLCVTLGIPACNLQYCFSLVWAVR